MNRTKALVIGVGAALIAWSCDAGEEIADAMVDAADVLRDAGEELRDGASSDAAAQVVAESFDVACDVQRTWRMEGPDGYFVSQTAWYAEVRDSRIDPEAFGSASWVACGRVETSTVDPPLGPDACATPGWTCTGETPIFIEGQCQAGAGVSLEPGVLRFLCGSSSESMDATTATTPRHRLSESRWTSVRFTVDFTP
jgi:hypothetical protein